MWRGCSAWLVATMVACSSWECSRLATRIRLVWLHGRRWSPSATTIVTWSLGLLLSRNQRWARGAVTAAPLLSLVLGLMRLLGWLLRLVGPRFIWHHDTHINISAFVIIRGAQFELHIFIDAELNIIQIILTTEVNIILSIFLIVCIVMISLFFSFVANKLLIVMVYWLATWSFNKTFTPIAALVVHRLLLNLMEVLRV